jgi:hypothetical protein
MYRFDSNGDTGEPWGYAATAVPRDSRPGSDTFPVDLFDRAFQPHPNQMQHTPVDDTSCQRAHQLRMRDAAEVISQIGIDHVRLSSVKPFLHLYCGLLGIAARPISILLRWQIGFEDRF